MKTEQRRGPAQMEMGLLSERVQSSRVVIVLSAGACVLFIFCVGCKFERLFISNFGRL